MTGAGVSPKVTLQSLRAPGLRSSVAGDFGIPTAVDGSPLPITFLRIQTDPRLTALMARVQAEARLQFAPGESKEAKESEDDEAYRVKLESWADALEIMLEEVLNELDRIKPARIPKLQEMS